ncbi:MAG: hypothetical protein JWM42_2429 [Burkholderia sp.]|nr:hypothetical protein [Burkholderia sp.]
MHTTARAMLERISRHRTAYGDRHSTSSKDNFVRQLLCNPVIHMTAKHKNKTLATLLAFVLGGLGAHRFYLHGRKDKWAWGHVMLFPFSIYAGFIEALVIGLMPDDKWDATHNPDSGRKSDSGWPLAILLVLTVGFGAIAVIGTMARIVDYLYTGGAYG